MTHSASRTKKSPSRVRSPSRVDLDERAPLESRRKPKDGLFTRKNASRALNTLGLASQPITTTFVGFDKMYKTVFNKHMKKGTRKNQVDPAQARATELPSAYPVLSTNRSRGGKKKNKTQRKTRKHKK